MNIYSNVDSYEEVNRKLLKQYKNNNLSVKNVIVELNLNLVRKIANKYKGMYNVSYDDLFQEGTIALIKAIDDFDILLETKFSTYAGTCISNAIMNYINSNRFVTFVSRDDVLIFNKYEKLKESGMNNEEIAKKLKISVKKLNDIVEGFKNIKNNLSLDANIEDSDELTIMNICEGEDNIREFINNTFRKELLEELKRILTEKQFMVIYYKCGFDSVGPLNGVELARITGTTRKNIFKIWSNAIRKIRQNDSIKKLLWNMNKS